MHKHNILAAAVLSAALGAPVFAQVDLPTQPVAAEAMQTTIQGEVMVVLIELQTGRDAGGMGAEGKTEVERAPGSDKPAGTITDTLTLYGKIVGVDKAAGTVTIKGAETTRVFPVEDKALLDELKVGDGVVAKFRNVISGEVTVK